jgi:hypothetical protein
MLAQMKQEMGVELDAQLGVKNEQVFKDIQGPQQQGNDDFLNNLKKL